MASIYDLPNDINREIMNQLDYNSICNLYATNKIFWVLPGDKIKYNRIIYQISQQNNKIFYTLSKDKIIKILNRVGFNKDKKRICVKPTINDWWLCGIKSEYVFIKGIVEYDELIPNSYMVKINTKEYELSILITELATLLMKS